MSATVRRYSASVAWRPTGSIATDRLRSIFSRLVYPLRIIGRKHQVWPKHAPDDGRMVDVRWEREDMRITLSGRDHASYAAISGKARNRHTCLPRTWGAAIQRQASPASSSGQPPRPIKCARVPARVRLQARQRWPRRACDPGVSRASQYSEHHPLYGAGVGSVQELLAGLTYEASPLPRTASDQSRRL